MTKQIRWGMIGCGAVTEVKSGPAYQQAKGFVLQGVTRRDVALAADYAKRDRKSTRLNSSHPSRSRMPSSA